MLGGVWTERAWLLSPGADVFQLTEAAVEGFPASPPAFAPPAWVDE